VKQKGLDRSTDEAHMAKM